MGHSAQEKEILLNEMLIQVGLIQKRFQAEGEDEEKRWMIAQTKDAKAIQFLRETTTVMLHVIDAIGQMQPVNGIAISKHVGIPRGSISKMTRRLVEQEMISSESLPDNKKEVWFSLTPLGQSIYDIHKRLHVHIEHNVRRFLGRYNIEQMKFLVQCMKETSQASWVADEPEPHDESSQETSAMGDMLALLQQLDERKLQKAKELIQIAFFD